MYIIVAHIYSLPLAYTSLYTNRYQSPTNASRISVASWALRSSSAWSHMAMGRWSTQNTPSVLGKRLGPGV